MSVIPRIVIAGTHSGCGKTTVTRGIMQALIGRGYTVQPFKIGPDFIDPTYHTAICGRTSRNLDPFMMGEAGVIGTLVEASSGADFSVIEGVMGMYDGIDGTDQASTAHVMKITQSPGILVVDARGMSRSANAVVKGFLGFDAGCKLEGAIFNRVGSPRHRAMIEVSVAARPLGFIPRGERFVVESRHLGLKMAQETEFLPDFGECIEESCDLDALIGIASQATLLPGREKKTNPLSNPVRIGVAFDRAFCFYYQDNLDRLRQHGAELVFFSPMVDRLPDVDALYFGGGYPELHAGELETAGFKKTLKTAADDGMPIYAECGGLIYLGEEISLDSGCYRMAGVLPCSAEMTGKVQALGYSDGSWVDGPALAQPGAPIRGHEFHYSSVEPARDARFSIRLCRGSGIGGGRDGIFSHEAVGTYTHAYFTDNFSTALVSAAAAFKRT